MSLRPCVLMVTAACATAGAPQQAPNDATNHSDGQRNTGDGAQQIDAAGHVDSPPGSCANAFSGALATWSFTGEAGSQASTAATSSATGVNAGAVSRSASLTVASGVGSINSSNWATTASLDPSKYYTFTVTPPSGCQMDLTTLSIDTKISSTGPSMAVVATSDDAFGQTSSLSTSTSGVVSTPTLHVSGATSMVELRVYGFAASATGGTFRIQNTLTLNGALR